MAKYTKRQQLSKKEENDLIIDFCRSISSLSSPEESALFISDLITKAEIRMLAKRLKVAKLLIQNMTYDKISQELHVSYNTIARINSWLNQSGEGFRLILSRDKTYNHPKKPYLSQLKRKYPMYYWPEILLKEIIYSANKRQKDKLLNILSSLDKKTELTKEINTIIKQNYHTS